ncbi:hypothetical protein OFO07_01560 [Campylobacter sp. JMF_06 NA1]|uniref:hypothetical protein n=1 Tax=Campylobacter sp. JMF_06 NA1 TaxID=2983823 RepID=UPI0022E99EC4|nr:hypothetical protein [Campylobacter sp. JMF_06 NA1]MDA3077609.1 hypothetical protein [Campylobacter sp. JMF_06 NA1]
MKNLTLILIALLFWGCSTRLIHSPEYKEAKKAPFVFNTMTQKKPFLNAPQNCEYIGKDSISFHEVYEAVKRDYAPNFGFDTLKISGNLYANAIITIKAYQKGGNLVDLKNTYATTFVFDTLELDNIINFDIYKCKCLFMECL